MNCPNCKNPNQAGAYECEWCGAMMSNSIPKTTTSNTKNTLKFIFKGEWFLIDAKTDVYVNDTFATKGSVKDGFQFEIENTAILPVIKLKNLLTSKTIALPTLDINKSYLIELEYSRIWGNYSSKPKSIQQI